MEIPIWTAINDQMFGFYCGLWKGCLFFSFYDVTGQFYNHNETFQAVLCCFIITVFLQLRTLPIQFGSLIPAQTCDCDQIASLLVSRSSTPYYTCPHASLEAPTNFANVQNQNQIKVVVSFLLVCAPKQIRVLIEM